MFKRFNNRQLIIALAVLAVLYIGAVTLNSGGEQTFKKSISTLDTAQINKLVIMPGGGKDAVTLQKSGGAWVVELADGKTAPAASTSLGSAVNSLAALQATQLVSRDESKWNEFKVDTAGTRVQLFSGTESLLDIVLGRFEYKQTGPMNYVRLAEEDDVYLVNGFLEMSFNKGADEWRDKELVKSPQSEWMSLQFNYPADSSFQLIKGADNIWRFPDSTLANASKVSSFLSTISNLSGTNFTDTPVNTSPTMELQITGTGSAVQIRAFANADSTYTMTSNQNPSAYFEGESMWSRVFVGKGHFEEGSSN